MVDEVMQKSRERMRNLKRSPRCRPAASAAGRSVVDRIDDSTPPPRSSPSKPSSGKASASRVRINASTSRSRDADEVLRPLCLRRQGGPTGEIPGREIPGFADHCGGGSETGFNRHGQQLFGCVQCLLYGAFFVVAIVAEAHL